MQLIVHIQQLKLLLPSNCVSKRIGLCIIFFIAMLSIKAQDFGSNSSIWGSSSSNQNSISNPLYDDATWGTLPSEQTLNSIRNNSSRNNRRRLNRDAMGNLLQRDANGNIVYDMNGNPAIDSMALNQQSFLDPNNDPASLPPPPSDPADVPIDGGIAILLFVALGVGYKNRKKVIEEPEYQIA